MPSIFAPYSFNFLNIFINVLKQVKVEELLGKKKDLEATVENLQERGKEMKNILQIREVRIKGDPNIFL